MKSSKIQARRHNLSEKRERAAKQAASRRRKQVMLARRVYQACSLQ
jgi:hypothetical protein